MATIKITHVTASMPDPRNCVTGRYIKYYTFKTFIDNKGNKTYFFNDKETTRDAGNAKFIEIRKKGKDIEVTTSEKNYTYEELIDHLMAGYDNYVEYIDDFRQYESAKKSNQEIMEKVKKIRQLIAQEE